MTAARRLAPPEGSAGRRTPGCCSASCGRRQLHPGSLAGGLCELPGVGVLLELHELAVGDIPDVRDLRIEGLAGGLRDCVVTALHHDYRAAIMEARNLDPQCIPE